MYVHKFIYLSWIWKLLSSSSSFFPFMSSNSLIPFPQVASSLNSSYCYILHSGSTVFTWSGSLATTDDQELVERQLDLIKVWQVLFSLKSLKQAIDMPAYGSYLLLHTVSVMGKGPVRYSTCVIVRSCISWNMLNACVIV